MRSQETLFSSFVQIAFACSGFLFESIRIRDDAVMTETVSIAIQVLGTLEIING